MATSAGVRTMKEVEAMRNRVEELRATIAGLKQLLGEAKDGNDDLPASSLSRIMDLRTEELALAVTELRRLDQETCSTSSLSPKRARLVSSVQTPGRFKQPSIRQAFGLVEKELVDEEQVLTAMNVCEGCGNDFKTSSGLSSDLNHDQKLGKLHKAPLLASEKLQGKRVDIFSASRQTKPPSTMQFEDVVETDTECDKAERAAPSSGREDAMMPLSYSVAFKIRVNDCVHAHESKIFRKGPQFIVTSTVTSSTSEEDVEAEEEIKDDDHVDRR